MMLLQMLSGGEAQKQRLKGMQERILQRTMPIEEVRSFTSGVAESVLRLVRTAAWCCMYTQSHLMSLPHPACA